MNNFSNYIEQYPIYSKEEEKEMLLRIKNGDFDAREDFINHNYLLVLDVCRKYLFDFCDFDDLFQSGVIGLIKALDKYDLNKGASFSTYAFNWIRREILITGYSSFSLIASSKIQREYRDYINKKEILLQTYGDNLTLEDIASKLGLTIEKVRKYEQLAGCEVSLNYVYDNEFSTKDNFVPDDFDTFEKVYSKMIREDLVDVLSQILDERELQIVLMHYGFYSDCMTFTEISKQLYSEKSVSRQYVEKVSSKALKKLRSRKETFVEWGFLD